VNADFIHDTREYFDALVAPLDFTDPHSVDVINQWAGKQTHGKIKEILAGMPGPNDRLFLANAVYFKGKWPDPFKIEDTTNRPFYLSATASADVPMMTKTKKFTYAQGASYQAVRLPYAGGNMAMYLFLPDTNSSPGELISGMSGDIWKNKIKPGFSDQRGMLGLPRFRLDYGAELKPPLQALGMKSTFGSGADFSGIAPHLYVSSVVQKAFVDVNEQGTEAAAVTRITVTAQAMEMPSRPFEMIVDRPFFFLIEDNQTGVILFMGLVFDPVEK
jgi:serpin B